MNFKELDQGKAEHITHEFHKLVEGLSILEVFKIMEILMAHFLIVGMVKNLKKRGREDNIRNNLIAFSNEVADMVKRFYAAKEE